MTLYQATNASDTMDMVAMLIAAYCQKTDMDRDTLTSYLQTSQQHSRAAGPTNEDRAHLAGLLGEPVARGHSPFSGFSPGTA
ncbi:hypothetical protein GCM10012285_28140 [Streptomyces kronopolitis]|uniref:Uncharacterized protein n=1 Tax=Streptomyces kronopolitis TaxID=1612435 RepID=A0ABQ2JCS6_9ACTN|nr:hypothetical protein GCM10012285_28140 [Streptomyces kronopolitis]